MRKFVIKNDKGLYFNRNKKSFLDDIKKASLFSKEYALQFVEELKNTSYTISEVKEMVQES